MPGSALSMQDIVVDFVRTRDMLGRPTASVRALKGVSIAASGGECVGVVGESGSGKSTLAAVATGLLAPTGGEVRLDGHRLAPTAERRAAAELRAIQIVFQDPASSLDPSMPIWRIVAEGLAVHNISPRAERRTRVAELLGEVGLGSDFLDRRPHQLSGGQRQRVAIARALAVEPEVIVLDEPTSALDVSVQAQILNLLLALQLRRGLSYIMISHDLEVIRHMCQRIYVMRDGEVVESGDVAIVFDAPSDPYTKRLVSAIPRIGT